jgi:hypothetical protein
MTGRKAFLLSFAFGFAVRLIPEALSYPYLIGFDTPYYAARIRNGIVWSDVASMFSMWLSEGVLISVQRISQVDTFLLLKLVGPFLFALNAAGVYYFCRRALNWKSSVALIAVFVFTFQIATLRLSWDLFRNLLGLSILLFSLPLLKSLDKWRSLALLMFLSTLIAFTHFLVAAVLLFIALCLAVNEVLLKRKKAGLRILGALLPLLMLSVVSAFFLSRLPKAQPTMQLVDEVVVRPSGLFFMIDYMSASTGHQLYASYASLAAQVLSLFVFLYVLYIPLVYVGFFRDRMLTAWTLLLLVGSFSLLVSPFFALDLWDRWMFMLAYPFTFYAANGIQKVLKGASRRFEGASNQRVGSSSKYPVWLRLSRRKILGITFTAIALGTLFMAVPPFFDRFGLFQIPTVVSYVPSTMQYSTMPLRDVRSTFEVLRWLNEQMNQSSVLVVHHAFFWWAKSYLDSEWVIISFVRDIDKALRTASEQGYQVIYTVWWNEQFLTWRDETIGWYGFTLPPYFSAEFSFDRISAYKYIVS